LDVVQDLAVVTDTIVIEIDYALTRELSALGTVGQRLTTRALSNPTVAAVEGQDVRRQTAVTLEVFHLYLLAQIAAETTAHLLQAGHIASLTSNVG